ncbi:MAG: ATP-binding protein, partial [Planctomycetota bacterium]
MSTAPAAASGSYTAKNITALEGLEPVRKRPGMYIGGVGAAGLHHLVWEIFDNSVDEAMNGHATEISVRLHKDGTTVTVSDNGRGIPVDKHPKTKKSALEMVLTILHAGGKFENGNYKTSGGLHGVGASVVNALSKELVAVVRRDGAQYRMAFAKGHATSKLQKLKGAVRGSGTTITFSPDPTIFPKVKFDSKTIRERLEIASYLHRGVKVHFHDETSGEKVTFLHAEGIVDYLKKVLPQRQTLAIHE